MAKGRMRAEGGAFVLKGGIRDKGVVRGEEGVCDKGGHA